MPDESPLSLSFPPNLCVCVCVCVCGGGGGGVGAWVCKRVSVYVSECVCLLYPSILIFSSSFCFG